MALGLTEEHQALAVAVRSLAERHCPPEVIRAAADGADSGCAQYRASLGPGLAGQGVLGLHVPEDHGGQGFGLPELAIALEELGRALVPGAFLPTVFASAALTTADAPGKLLAGLADGSRTGAVALAAGLRGRRDGRGGLIIDGSTWPVLGASTADLLILPVQTDEGELWAAADTTTFDISELDSLDLTRPVARVTASGLSLPADRVLTGIDRAAITSLAATLFGAEACGIAGWSVHAAAGYAKERRQFGRPIGQFQGVKHRCARMLTAAEQAAAAVWDAARAHGDAGATAAQRELAATVAAVIALDAAVSCAHDTIQVLGGIGYTWDHDAHLYYRRALSLRALLGPPEAWAERAAELALGGTRRTMDVDLPDDALDVRGQIRAELRGIAALDRARHARLLASGGWVMPHLPHPWGRAAGPLEQVVVAQEMKAAGLRPPLLAIGAWVVPALVRYGTPQQQERFLPQTLCGGLVWCQLFSEPGAGSDLAGLSTRAEPAEGGWRITGQKIWTSLARQADWAICIARTDPAAPRHDGISYFLVDMTSPGVEVRPLREMTGDAIFNEVFLDDVFVPADCVVGAVNGGWRVARTTLANERVALSSSWGYGSGVTELLNLAVARGGAGAADAHGGAGPADAHGGAGAPAWSGDLRQLGRFVCESHALDLLGLRVTLKQLCGTEPGATSSVRKLLGMQHAQGIADFCLAALGPEGALGPASPAPCGGPTARPTSAGPPPAPTGPARSCSPGR